MLFPHSTTAPWAKGLLLLSWLACSLGPVLGSPARTTSSSSQSISRTSTRTTAAAEATISLSTEITDFIPACALTCFKSFVDDNFDTSVCGSVPSLECLCQQTGSSGYTIGEGATECIVAENDINKCVGMAFGSSEVTAAYGMCNNQTNAAPETHATIVATLVVNSGSIVVATPSARSTTTTTLGSTAATKSATISSTPTTPTASSSLSSTMTASMSSQSLTSSTTSSTPAPVATATATSSARKLSAAQAAGIAVGSIAAVALAALAALFFYYRRRRGFSRMSDTWSEKRVQGTPSSLDISAPRYREPKIMSFTRALANKQSTNFSRGGSERPATLGLAIDGAGAGAGAGAVDGTIAAETLPAVGRAGGVATQGAEQRASNEVLTVRNARESMKTTASPPPPPVPPLSPRRAVNSFRFFPDAGLPDAHTEAQYFAPQQQQHHHQQSSTLSALNKHQQNPTSTTAATNNNRPELSIQIPHASSASTSGPFPAHRSTRLSTASTNRNVFHGRRDSVVTEFAEDGEDSADGVGAAGSGPTIGGHAQIWRRPNTDPQSATTYYVSDKWGNWVLRDIATDPEAVSHVEDQRQVERQQQQQRQAIAELATPVSKTAEERQAELQRQPQRGARTRPEIDTDIIVEESDAVRAALTHLSSPTIPASVALGLSEQTQKQTQPRRPALTQSEQKNESSSSSNSNSSGNTCSTPSSMSSRKRPILGRSTIRLVMPDSGRLPMNSRSGGGGSKYLSYYYSSRYSSPTVDARENSGNTALPPTTATASQSPPDMPHSRDLATGGFHRFSIRRHSSSRSGSRTRSSKNDAGSSTTRPAGTDRQQSRDSATTIMSTETATTIVDSPIELDEFPLPVAGSNRGSSLLSSSLRPTPPVVHDDYSNRGRVAVRNLSPVAESLQSQSHSSVRYPEIPKPQSSISKGRPGSKTGPSPVVRLTPMPPVARNNNNGSSSSSNTQRNFTPTFGVVGSARPTIQSPPTAATTATTTTTTTGTSGNIIPAKPSYGQISSLSSGSGSTYRYGSVSVSGSGTIPSQTFSASRMESMSSTSMSVSSNFVTYKYPPGTAPAEVDLEREHDQEYSSHLGVVSSRSGSPNMPGAAENISMPKRRGGSGSGAHAGAGAGTALSTDRAGLPSQARSQPGIVGGGRGKGDKQVPKPAAAPFFPPPPTASSAIITPSGGSAYSAQSFKQHAAASMRPWQRIQQQYQQHQHQHQHQQQQQGYFYPSPPSVSDAQLHASPNLSAGASAVPSPDSRFGDYTGAGYGAVTPTPTPTPPPATFDQYQQSSQLGRKISNERWKRMG